MVRDIPYHVGEPHQKEVTKKMTVCTVSYIKKDGGVGTKDVPATKKGVPYSETYQYLEFKGKDAALAEHKRQVYASNPNHRKQIREDKALVEAIEKNGHKVMVHGGHKGKLFTDEYQRNKAKNILRAKHGMAPLPTAPPKVVQESSAAPAAPTVAAPPATTGKAAQIQARKAPLMARAAREPPTKKESRGISLERLEPGKKIDDEIINKYLELLKSRCTKNYGLTNTQFAVKLMSSKTTMEELNNWHGIKGKKLASFDKFLIPMVVGEYHWVLIVIEKREKVQNHESVTVKAYDSLKGGRGPDMKQLNKIMEFLKWQGTLPRFDIARDIPKQNNGYDCGVFVMEYARCILLDQPMSFKQKDMKKIRERIKAELSK